MTSRWRKILWLLILSIFIDCHRFSSIITDYHRFSSIVFYLVWFNIGVITSTQWVLKAIDTSFINFRDILLCLLWSKTTLLRKGARFTLAYRLLVKYNSKSSVMWQSMTIDSNRCQLRKFYLWLSIGHRLADANRYQLTNHHRLISIDWLIDFRSSILIDWLGRDATVLWNSPDLRSNGQAVKTSYFQHLI